MKKVYARPSGIFEGAVTGFCPGCMHSSVSKLICEVLDELKAVDNACYVQGVGCCGLAITYFDFDTISSPHGRACAVASALKRCSPETLVFTYQGDGDLAAIGLAETMSAANRGENFSVVFVNNGTYGMTGGQLAPTTLIGAKTTTSPYGRQPEEHGYPLHMCELLSQLEAPAYIARVTCADVPNTRKAKAAIKKAFEYQLAGKGFSFVEIVSNCPTNWGMSPLESLDYVHDTVLKEFPLGEFRAK
ncbi:MAG TPA: 2-oxoglutarate oxidoreductase [Clostridiales bacterium]|jgi:2-oxoglutarate ferredoxin oxidoreductase subunit beta|nr:2-oxoglutarate oxidoreductase [Clostridiales bacterium]